MANIDPAPSWANIRRLETTDRNMAGPGGILNDPTTSIAARLNLLRDNDTTLGNSVAAVNSRQDATDTAIANIQGQVLTAPGTLSDLENGDALDPAAGFPDVPSVENTLGPVAAINESIESLTARTKQLRGGLEAFGDYTGASSVGIGQGGTVQDALTFVTPEMFGALGGTIDDLAALQAMFAAAASGSLAVRLGGRFYSVSQSIVVPGGVDVDGEGGGFSALPSFPSDTPLVYVDRATTGNNFASYRNARFIRNLRLKCNAVPGIRGLSLRTAERDRIENLCVYECVSDGVRVESGYGAHLLNVTIVGASVRRGSARGTAANAVGVRIDATDCVVSVADVSFFNYGVWVTGGHNHFTDVHPWSSYWANDPPMLIGFVDEGEGNVYVGCNADSPSLADTALPVSKTNGGFGFYGDTNSIGRRIIAATVQSSGNGDRFPPTGTIVPFYVGRPRNDIYAWEVRDYASLISTETVRAVDTATFLQTAINGAQTSSRMSQTQFVAGTDASFTPAVAVGGSTTGITYASRSGWRKSISGRTDFKLSASLSSLGGLSGSVTIGGLPVSNQTGGVPTYFLAVFIGATSVTTGRALSAASSQSLVLQKNDGTPITAADLGNSAQIFVSGTIMSTYGV